MRRPLFLLASLLALAPACVNDQFRCGGSAECMLGDGTQGRCEGVGYCSFPDSAMCASGFRFGHYAGAGLADQCVGGMGAGGGDGGGNADNLVTGGDFESGCQGLLGVGSSTVRQVPLGHGGANSCEVCGGGSNNMAQARFAGLRPPEVGKRYRFSIWVKIRSGFFLQLGVQMDDLCGESISSAGNLGVDFQELSEELASPCAQSSIGEITLGAIGSEQNPCFLIDDLSIASLP